jgi:hypothetical protein
MSDPIDPQELTKAKERMKGYAEEKDKITVAYYKLYDENFDYIKATESINEALEWEAEGPKRREWFYRGTDEEFYVDFPLRNHIVAYKKVKREILEAFSVGEESQDLSQDN